MHIPFSYLTRITYLLYARHCTEPFLSPHPQPDWVESAEIGLWLGAEPSQATLGNGDSDKLPPALKDYRILITEYTMNGGLEWKE